MRMKFNCEKDKRRRASGDENIREEQTCSHLSCITILRLSVDENVTLSLSYCHTAQAPFDALWKM